MQRVAVLFGDFLLSRGLLLALDHHDYGTLHATSDAVRRMSEGELLQIEKTRHLDIDEDTYFRIISDKTASLIAACTTPDGPLELAMSVSSLTGFQSWLESGPPGTDWDQPRRR